MKQLTLPLTPRPPRTFANFIAGPNAAALSQLGALVLPSAPVYLWGPPASGKTHLLRALAHRCGGEGRDGGRRVDWFDQQRALPWSLKPDAALLVLDGCEAFDANFQHAAFTVFVDASTLGVQVAAAGRLPPVDLPLRDDLRSRLGWGDVHALQALDEADTQRALRAESQARGMRLGDDVIDHLLERFPRDLSSLMRLLDRLDEFGLSKHRQATVPLVREFVRELIDEEGPLTDEAGLDEHRSA